MYSVRTRVLALLLVAVLPVAAAPGLSCTQNASTGPYNLTTEGTANWAAYNYNWDDSFPTATVTKSGGTGTITASLIGTGLPSCNHTSDYGTTLLSWTDGTPTASVTDERWYVNTSYATGIGSCGFRVTVPAGTGERTVYIHLTTRNHWAAPIDVTFTAHLSDASAPDYTHKPATGAPDAYAPQNYICTYTAAATTTLVLDFVNNTGDYTSVGVNGVAITAASGGTPTIRAKHRSGVF